MSKVIPGFFYDIGGREIYEDRVTAVNIQTAANLNLTVAIVADGVGGENKGERAAQLAVDVVQEYLRESTDTDIPTLLGKAVAMANQVIYGEVKDLEGATSSTLAMAVIHNDKTLYVANVGDSRVYLCRGDKLTQLTIDHNFATVMPWQGKLSKELARENPRADVLMRALGPRERTPVDIGFYVGTDDYRVAHERGKNGLELKAGDSVLVCTDGLFKNSAAGEPYIKEEEIIRTLNTQEGEKAARTLVSFALGRNTDDNVSAAVLQMPDPRRAARARRPFFIYGAAGALVLILAIVLISNALRRSAEGRLQEQQASVNATATAEAGSLALAGTQAAANLNAAATADAARQAGETQAERQTREAEFSVTQATQEAILASAATAVFLGGQCNNPNAFTWTSSEPKYEPKIGSTLVRGDPPPTVQATWGISNSGICEWTGVKLRSLKGNGDARIRLEQNGVVLDTIPAGALVQLIVIFDGPEAVQTLDEEWRFIVADGDGKELDLIGQGMIAFKPDGWITIVEPSATPTLTPTPTNTPIPTNTPTPEPPTPVPPTSPPSSKPTVPPKP